MLVLGLLEVLVGRILSVFSRFTRHERICAHITTGLYTGVFRQSAGSERGQTAPIALLDESRASANVSTGSLGEILDIITASGCADSGLGVMPGLPVLTARSQCSEH